MISSGNKLINLNTNANPCSRRAPVAAPHTRSGLLALGGGNLNKLTAFSLVDFTNGLNIA